MTTDAIWVMLPQMVRPNSDGERSATRRERRMCRICGTRAPESSSEAPQPRNALMADWSAQKRRDHGAKGQGTGRPCLGQALRATRPDEQSCGGGGRWRNGEGVQTSRPPPPQMHVRCGLTCTMRRHSAVSFLSSNTDCHPVFNGPLQAERPHLHKTLLLEPGQYPTVQQHSGL